MSVPTTKTQLFTQLQQEHAYWEALLAEIGRERMEEPGVTGDWTMKDTIAHLTTWWRRRVAQLEAARRGERPVDHPPQPHVEIINHWIYLTNRDRPLDDVLRDAEDAWRQFEATLDTFSEETLFDPAAFDWLDGQALGPAVVGGFAKHLHEEHESMIRAWLRQR